jgi:hypothetical protein
MGRTTIIAILGLLATTFAARAAAPEPAAVAARPWALLTIADGEVTVLRGRLRLAAAEGLRLEPQDIVHTDAAARVARVEFGDGSVLDLGPATQALLQPQGRAWPKERVATAYIAQGWAKLRTPRAAAQANPGGLASATLDLATPDGGVVLAHITPTAAFAFVEAGRAQLLEYRGTREPRELALGEGHAYTRSAAGEIGTAVLRPTPAQLRETPRALSDTLPLRAVQWAQRAAPALAAGEPVQASDVALWLDSEPALRSSLRARFTDSARGAGKSSVRAVAHVPSPSKTAALAKPAKAKAASISRLAVLAPARLSANAATTPERDAAPALLSSERVLVATAGATLGPIAALAPLPAAAPSPPAAANPKAPAPSATARPRPIP